APLAVFLFADVERAVARIGDASLDLARDHPRPQTLGQDLAALESEAVFLYRPFLERRVCMDRLAIAAQTQAVTYATLVRNGAEQGQRSGGLVHFPRPEHGVTGIVAVAGNDDDAPIGQLGQIDVVDQARRLAEQRATGEVVDVEAR